MSNRQYPPVLAYHLIWTAYGTWLSNDPRGSGSRKNVAEKLVALGEVHFGRKAIQPRRSVVRDFYEQAEDLLKHDVICFDERQRVAIAAAFADVIRSTPYTCYACAIMPDHVHLVIRKHRHRAEEMIERLQEASRWRLIADGLVPATHPVWTLGGWKRFLDSTERIVRTVAYAEGNPDKEGLAPQKWSFVTPYDGWPYKRGRRLC